MIKNINTIASETISFNMHTELIKSKIFQFKRKPAGSNHRIAKCSAGG